MSLSPRTESQEASQPAFLMFTPRARIINSFIGAAEGKRNGAGKLGNVELSLKKGDRVSVVKRGARRERGVWWVGYNIRGERGVFPDWCIDSSSLKVEDLQKASVADQKYQSDQVRKARREAELRKAEQHQRAAVNYRTKHTKRNKIALFVPHVAPRSGVLFVRNISRLGKVTTMRLHGRGGMGSSGVAGFLDPSGIFALELNASALTELGHRSMLGPVLECIFEESLVEMERIVRIPTGPLFAQPGTRWALAELGNAEVWFQDRRSGANGEKASSRCYNLREMPNVSMNVQVCSCREAQTVEKKLRVGMTLFDPLSKIVAQLVASPACVVTKGKVASFGGNRYLSAGLNVPDLSRTNLVFGVAEIVLLAEEGGEAVGTATLSLYALYQLFCNNKQKNIQVELPMEKINRIGSVRTAVLKLDVQFSKSNTVVKPRLSLTSISSAEAMSAIGRSPNSEIEYPVHANEHQLALQQPKRKKNRPSSVQHRMVTDEKDKSKNYGYPAETQRASDCLGELLASRDLQSNVAVLHQASKATSNMHGRKQQKGMASMQLDKLLSDRGLVAASYPGVNQTDLKNGTALFYDTDSSSEESQDDDETNIFSTDNSSEASQDNDQKLLQRPAHGICLFPSGVMSSPGFDSVSSGSLSSPSYRADVNHVDGKTGPVIEYLPNSIDSSQLSAWQSSVHATPTLHHELTNTSADIAPGARVTAHVTGQKRQCDGVVKKQSDIGFLVKFDDGELQDLKPSEITLVVQPALNAAAVVADGAKIQAATTANKAPEESIDTSTNSTIKVGARVSGQLRGWAQSYLGIVTAVVSNGYEVKFDDEEEAVLTREEILAVLDTDRKSDLPVGARVTAQLKGWKRPFDGVVDACREKTETGEKAYIIVFDDGDVQALTRHEILCVLELPAKACTDGTSSKILIGMRVTAQLTGWVQSYKGFVSDVTNKGFLVKFDDGDVQDLTWHEILSIHPQKESNKLSQDSLSPGTRILGQLTGWLKPYKGTVQEATHKGWCVVFDDGGKQDLSQQEIVQVLRDENTPDPTPIAIGDRVSTQRTGSKQRYIGHVEAITEKGYRVLFEDGKPRDLMRMEILAVLPTGPAASDGAESSKREEEELSSEVLIGATVIAKLPSWKRGHKGKVEAITDKDRFRVHFEDDEVYDVTIDDLQYVLAMPETDEARKVVFEARSSLTPAQASVAAGQECTKKKAEAEAKAKTNDACKAKAAALAATIPTLACQTKPAKATMKTSAIAIATETTSANAVSTDDVDPFVKYHSQVLEQHQRAALYLCEQDRLEAIRRGLGGRLVLPREALWRAVADMGLWGEVASQLGNLSANMTIELPLLDLEALGAVVNQPPTSLALKLLRKGFIELLRIDAVESCYEHWQLSKVEQAMQGYSNEEAASANAANMDVPDYDKKFLQPLDKWSTSHVCTMIAAAGWESNSFKNLNVNGFELASLERQGAYGLEEGLKSLGVNDPLVRQRLQYELSLVALRFGKGLSTEMEDGSSSGSSSMYNNERPETKKVFELEDAAWWSGSSFGVRARKALKEWTCEDVARFAKTLRLTDEMINRLGAFAIDGKALLELNEREMEEELGMTHDECCVFKASILLLNRPPELDFGASSYLKLRVSNQQGSAWMENDIKMTGGMLCLAFDRVHTLILRPGKALLDAVEAVRKAAHNGGDDKRFPAVRIWYRVLEYSNSLPLTGDKPVSKSRLQKPKQQHWRLASAPTARANSSSKDNTAICRRTDCFSFSDAGTTSITGLLRERLGQCVTSGDRLGQCVTSGDRLMRWDPLHPLLRSNAGIVNGWRYLSTTSVDRGLNEECTRGTLCFDTVLMREFLDNPNIFYRICFNIQVGTMTLNDDMMEVHKLWLTDSAGRQGTLQGSNMFTISPAFKVVRKELPVPRVMPFISKTNAGQKKKKKKKKTIQRPLHGKSKPILQQHRMRVQEQQRDYAKQVLAKPVSTAAAKLQHKVHEQPVSPKRYQRRYIHSEKYQEERMEHLEASQQLVDQKLEQLCKDKAKAAKSRNYLLNSPDLRTAAAFELGALLGVNAQSPECTLTGNKRCDDVDELRQTVQVRLNEIQSQFAKFPATTLNPLSVNIAVNAVSPTSPDSSSSSSLSDFSSSPSSSGSGSDWFDDKDNGNNNGKTKSDNGTWANSIAALPSRVQEQQHKDDLTSLWAERVKSRYLDQEFLTYPLRPNSASSATAAIAPVPPAFDKRIEEQDAPTLVVSGTSGLSTEADATFKKIRLAVCRLGAQTCFGMLSALDSSRCGWLSLDVFFQFVFAIGHAHDETSKQEIKENLQILQQNVTLQRNGTLVTEMGGTLYVRYERLVYGWTMADAKYAEAVAKRIWDLAAIKEFELLYFMESSGGVHLSILNELDPDVTPADLKLLLNHRRPAEYLTSPLLRANPAKFRDAITSSLRERQHECQHLFSLRDPDRTEEVSGEHFALVIYQLLGLRLTANELHYFSAKTESTMVISPLNLDTAAEGSQEEASESEAAESSSSLPTPVLGKIAYHTFFDVGQNVNLFDHEALLEHLLGVDKKGTGFVSGPDMCQALCATAQTKSDGQGHEYFDTAKKLSHTYEKRHMMYCKWMETTFENVRHDMIVNIELRRLGLWFSLLSTDDQCAMLELLACVDDGLGGFDTGDSGNNTQCQHQQQNGLAASLAPIISRTTLQKAFADKGFSTLYFFDVCVYACADSNGDVNFERLLSAALATLPGVSTGGGGGVGGGSTGISRISQTAMLWYFVLNRLVKTAGGIDHVLKDLNTIDHEGTGLVSFDSLSSVLQCSKTDLELGAANDGTLVHYESLLGELATAFPSWRRLGSEQIAKSFVYQKIRRAAKRCKLTNGCLLAQLLFSHDETQRGWVTTHQLSWELRLLQIYLECEGAEARYLLKGFGNGNLNDHVIDYESLVLAVAIEDALSYEERDRIKREFVLHFFKRCLSFLESQYIGMLHLFDASWEDLDDIVSAGTCSRLAFKNVLQQAFSGVAMDDSKLASAATFASELYVSDNKCDVRYEDFAIDVSSSNNSSNNSPSDDMTRHAITLTMRAVDRNNTVDLFEVYRKLDGDLDGHVSARNINKGLAQIGCGPLGPDAFIYLNCSDECSQTPGSVVLYEVFLERAQAVKNNDDRRLGAPRLQSILRRINQRVMRENPELRSSKHVFLHLHKQADRSAALNEWDVFNLLHEHDESVQTIEELTVALKDLLVTHNKVVKDSQDQGLSLGMIEWLCIV